MSISHLDPLFAKCLLKCLGMSTFKKTLRWLCVQPSLKIIELNHNLVSTVLFCDVLLLSLAYFGSEGT